MVNISLPPALDKKRHPISEEVAFSRSLTPEQRLEILAKVCRADLEILKLNGHKQELLRNRDPLPPSTITALERLRAN